LTSFAADTLKVGVLQSLSGTMAISETVLKDVALMAFEEINAKGGVMGHKIEPVVVDPASNWPLFAEKARQLLTQDKVAAVFGCWTSVSRKSVLPVFEELNGVLFYPVQYEGEELSKNVFYTGAAPNQQAIPAVEYLMSKEGGGAKRWVLLGTDYVYPRTTNKILRAFLKSKGVDDKDIDKKKGADYAKAKKLLGADKPLTNDPMEATYIGIYMWKQAVEKAKSFDSDKVIAAMGGQSFKAPNGFTVKMDEKNHHLHKPVFIGEVKADGQFNVVWKTKGPIKAQPRSPFIAGNHVKKAEA